MATYYSNSNNTYRLRLDVTNRDGNSATNQSVIEYTLYLDQNNKRFNGLVQTGNLTIDGVSRYTKPERFNSTEYPFNSYIALASGSFTVTHTSDGSKTVSLVANFSANSGGNGPVGLAINETFVLTTIPRASSFTLSGSTQTNADINVAISRKSSSFNHRVRWRVGSGSWNDVQSYTWSGTSTSFKVQPGNMANLKSATITVGVQTYSGSTAIGSEATTTRTITIPNSTISLSGTASTGSSQTVSISNSGGSLTYTRSWSLGNATGGNVASWTPPHSAISTSGTLTCTVVTKNGTATINTVSATRTITVPNASSFTLSGATQTNANINVNISKTWSSFSHRVRWRASGSTSWKTVQDSSWSGTSTSFAVQPSDIPNSQSKEIEVGVQTYSGSTAIRSEVISKRTVTIPNTTISLSGTAVTGNSQTVSISNNGGSLTYTRSWSLGNATGGNSNSWTPPHSALSGGASGTLTCTVVTKNGTATINTTSATRTITAPNSSSFTLSGATQTNADINVTISRTSSSFTHRVRWRVGSGSWNDVQSNTWSGTSTSFKIQPSNMPNLKSATITVGVQTYTDSGATPIRSEVTSTRTITIPNTTISLSGTANTGSVQTVAITNSGGSLTHTISWSLGSGTGGNSTTWTPPHSALPSTDNGILTCTVVTKNGTATINTAPATRTIYVPSSVKPTFTSITHTEAVSDVSTKVGAYVQGHTKLKLGVTGASAGSGSSIKSYSISVAGQTVGNGGTTPAVINQSGTLTITATVTDNRNRSLTNTTTINVLAYENPIVTGVSFTRTGVDGTPNTSGTHLTIKATIRVRKLIVNTAEKNKIWYQAESAQVGQDYVIKTDEANQAGSSNGDYREVVYTETFSGYPVDYPYNVRVRGGDIFSGSGYIAGGIPTGVVLQHWGEDTTAFGKMIDDVNYNVLVGAKGLKSDGPIIDRDGKDVSKPSWSDVSGKPAQATRWPAWSEVTSKPSTFAPSAHNQAWSTITSPPATATRWPAWTEVTSRPSDNQFPNTAQAIGGSQNLNNYTTPGFYYQNANASAANGSNYPIARAGTLIVTKDAGTTQMYYEYNGAGVYYRTFYGSTWTAWQNLLTPTWANVSSKPSTFAPSSHTHAWAQVTGAPAQATRWPSWSEVTSKPSTFTPSAHNQAWSTITSQPATATRWPTWAEVTGKPSTFSPSTHTHSATRTTILGMTAFASKGAYNLTQSITNFDLIVIYVYLNYVSDINNSSIVWALSPTGFSNGSVLSGGFNFGTNRGAGFFFQSNTQIKNNNYQNLVSPRIKIEGIKFTS